MKEEFSLSGGSTGIHIGFTGKKGLPLGELMKQADTTKPVILLDHQPFHLDESAKYGVDLQLSGHTHNGQMWPLNYVTAMIYELSYGYLKKGNTQFHCFFRIWVMGTESQVGKQIRGSSDKY